MKEENTGINKEIEQGIADFSEYWNRRKKRIRVYRYCLLGVLFCCSFALGVWGYFNLYNKIPSVLRVREGEVHVLDWNLPMKGKMVAVSDGGESNIPREEIILDLSEEVTLEMSVNDRYLMDVKLFGCLPFKKMEIQVVGDKELIPAGIPIGIYVETEGVLVVGVGSFEGERGISYSPSQYILRTGDYILECNGEKMEDKEAIIQCIEECCGKELILKIKREEEIQEVSVKPVKNLSGKYKIGVWLRDSAQGVGTLTYIDGEGNFGALGHGVADVDTAQLVKMEDGTIYKTEIVSIKRGKVGTPGQMTGAIIYDEKRMLGDIKGNSEEGIYGVCNQETMKLCEQTPIPIGLKQEVKKGKAQILCSLEKEPKYYNVEITGVHMEHVSVNRGIEILVTDVELLEKTGGIVQGMSGSPIIQDGKIIGAVTHVLVNDPTKGYGIFIENMLEH